MATIDRILHDKGSHVMTVGARATVHEAAVMMNDHHVGALVVTDGDTIEGIFTERDVLRRIVASDRDPRRTSIGDVMTRDVIRCSRDTSTDEARTLFRDRRIRHLPVEDSEGHLVGLISIGDLNAFELTDREQTLSSLQEYLYGGG